MSFQPSSAKIAYLVKIFPKISETFILQEILDLETSGLTLSIFTLQHPTEAITHGQAAQVRAPTTSLPDTFLTIPSHALWAHVRLLMTSPQRYVSTIRFWIAASDRPAWSKFVQAGALARSLLKGAFTHLHVHFANAPTSVAELAHRFTGIPYSMSCHAKDIFIAHPLALRRKMRHAEFVVTCTEDNRRHLQRISDGSTPIHRLYHGLNLDRFDRLRANHPNQETTIPTILSVGRFREKKGFLTLILACHLLVTRKYRFRCRIVGSGPLHAHIEHVISNLNLEHVVELAGPKTMEDVVACYQQADIFALPCQIAHDGDRDGIPNVLMEAMACRLPVVTTGVSGIPELVQHDRTGILVPPQEPETLALVLAHLLDNPSIRYRLGEAGRKAIELAFSSSHASHQLKALLLKQTTMASHTSLPTTPTASGPSQHPQVPISSASIKPADRIGYVLKGFPRRSEAFITNEILQLKRMGLRLHLFSAFPGEPVSTGPHTEPLHSSLTYLPEDRAHMESGFTGWLRANLPRYFPSHLHLIRTAPQRYFRTAWDAWTLSIRCRPRWFAWPKKVLYKDFIRAGAIADSVLAAGDIRHLHAHFCHGATTMAMFAGGLSGCPFSFTAHAKDIYLPRLNPGDLLSVKLRRAKFVVTCTKTNQQYLDDISTEHAPIHTIYHGVDTTYFIPLDDRSAPTIPTILSVGRFVEKKGFPFLIEACRLLRDHGIAFRCRIVGEPDEQSELVRNLIRQYGLEQEVSIGPGVSQEELRTIYQHATVFVLPCHIVENGDRDGIPNVLAEAMACGIPVISTAVSGIPEVINDRRNGLLVSPRNPEALAKAIEELLVDSDFRHTLAQAGRETICRIFDSRRTITRLFDLFHSNTAEPNT